MPCVQLSKVLLLLLLFCRSESELVTTGVGYHNNRLYINVTKEIQQGCSGRCRIDDKKMANFMKVNQVERNTNL